MIQEPTNPCLTCGAPVSVADWAAGERFCGATCARTWTDDLVGDELAALLDQIERPDQRIAAWQAAKKFLSEYIQRRRFAVRERTA